jgi:hypothetical protein
MDVEIRRRRPTASERPLGRSDTSGGQRVVSGVGVVVLLVSFGSASPASAQDYVGSPPGRGGGAVTVPTSAGTGEGDDDVGPGPLSGEGSDYVGIAPRPGRADDYVGIPPGRGRTDDYVGVHLAGVPARPRSPEAGVGGTALGHDKGPLAPAEDADGRRVVQGLPVSTSDGAILAGLGFAGLAGATRRARTRRVLYR